VASSEGLRKSVATLPKIGKHEGLVEGGGGHGWRLHVEPIWGRLLKRLGMLRIRGKLGRDTPGPPYKGVTKKKNKPWKKKRVKKSTLLKTDSGKA